MVARRRVLSPEHYDEMLEAYEESLTHGVRRGIGRRGEQHPLGAGEDRSRLVVSEYRVEFRPAALREIQKIDRTAQPRIHGAIALLAKIRARQRRARFGDAWLPTTSRRLPSHLHHRRRHPTDCGRHHRHRQDVYQWQLSLGEEGDTRFLRVGRQWEAADLWPGVSDTCLMNPRNSLRQVEQIRKSCDEIDVRFDGVKTKAHRDYREVSPSSGPPGINLLCEFV